MQRTFRPLRYFLLFCASLSVGWLCRNRPSASSCDGLPPSGRKPASLGAAALSQADPLDACVMIADALVDASAADMPQIAGVLQSSDKLDRRVWATVFSRWIRVDAPAAWAFATGKSGMQDEAELSVIALEQWAVIDPAAARKVVDQSNARQVMALVRGLLKSDPEGAFRTMDEARARNLPLDDPFDTNNRNEAIRALIGLGKRNPTFAIIVAERAKHIEWLGAAIVGWSDTNPTDARKWLEQRNDAETILLAGANALADGAETYQPGQLGRIVQWLPPGNHRSEAILHVLETVARRDADLALKEAGCLLVDPADRAEAIGKIAAVVAETDFEEAWKILEPVGPANLNIRRVIIPPVEISNHDVVRAKPGPVSYQSSLTPRLWLSSPAEVKSQLLVGWLDTDKPKALERVNGMTPKEVAQVADNFIGCWGSREPIVAIEWLARKLGNHGDPEEIYSWLPEMDIEGENFRRWLQTLPEGTVRTAVSLVAADELVDHDPLRAMQFAQECMAAEFVTDWTYRCWANKDPMAALKHLATDGKAPVSAWEPVVLHAWKNLPDRTVEVVESLPPGQAHDTAVSRLVLTSADGADPQRVTGWALSIDNTDLRREALDHVFNRVSLNLRLINDPELPKVLRELIHQRTGLTDQERALWLERVSREFKQP